MTDADLIIIGGGPAGCAAATMASSLGLNSLLVEAHSLSHKLNNISSLINVLGGFTNGQELATKIADDVSNASRCTVLLGRQATRIHADESRVEVVLDTAESYGGQYAIIATGVGPQTPSDVDWITLHDNVDLKALWEAGASQLRDQELIVLGIDRPLGTILRTHADVNMRLTVIYSEDEAYKADEVRTDSRVMLIPVRQAKLTQSGGVITVHVSSAPGESTIEVAGTHALLNLGSRPLKPDGDIVSDASGYCPPDLQHSRVLIAGDLRAARYQRIMTAFGSGAEAALKAYYELNRVN